MPDRPTLVFVRHGETDWNAEERLQGQKDIPLNDRGREQARRNGEAIAERFPDIGSYDFVSSPLGRSRETMEIVRDAIGLAPSDYRLDDRLREITFGHWEGYTLDELRAVNPEAVAAREADKWGFLPPGGESYRLLAERVEAWFESLERPTVAVAHGGVGRVLRRHMLDLDHQESVATTIPQDRAMLFHRGRDTWF